MNKAHLILLCDNYPNSDGEFFLDDEVNIIAKKFNKITVICSSAANGRCRTTPQNVEVISLPAPSTYQKLKSRFSGLFFVPLWQDFFSVRERFGLSPSLYIFKLLWGDFVKSSLIINTLEASKLINPDSDLLYAYWLDYKALALARIKGKVPGIIAIARGHGWDVDYKRHEPQYLPFKNFIVSRLSQTFTISDFGKNMLENVVEKKHHNKILVSKLGKVNHRVPLIDKLNNGEFLICSCSSIIPLKRIDKIIELISLVNNKQLKWVHFGSGRQMDMMKEKSLNLKVNATFMGNVENNKILDFYNSNFVDLFVNLSAFEGIPVSIMEAQSAGIPVLATNVGGTSEIVNNENGFLIDKDFDIKQTAELIKNYLNGSSNTITKKRQLSYHNWKVNYDAEKNYSEFTDAINSF